MVGRSTKSPYWSHLVGTCRMALDRSYPVSSVYPLSSYEQSVGWTYNSYNRIVVNTLLLIIWYTAFVSLSTQVIHKLQTVVIKFSM